MDYNQQIHTLIEEYIRDLVVRDCRWLWKNQEVVHTETLTESMISVLTVGEQMVREYLIYHTNAVPQAYYIRYLSTYITSDITMLPRRRNERKC